MVRCRNDNHRLPGEQALADKLGDCVGKKLFRR
jgi:hypothetical protein